MKISSIVIIMTFFLASCSSDTEPKNRQVDNINQNVEITVEHLIQAGVDDSNNDSINEKLNNLIVADTSYYKLYITDSFDETLGKTKLSFDRKYYSQEDISRVHFHGFEICISDDLFIDGVQNDLSFINDNYLNYYNLHLNGEYETESTEDSIKHFGVVKLLDLYAHIGMNLKSSNLIEKSKWQTFFKSINEIVSCYDKLREDVAIEKFKKSFQDLSQIEKVSVIEYRPLKIMISFDMEFCSEIIKPKELGSVEH